MDKVEVFSRLKVYLEISIFYWVYELFLFFICDFKIYFSFKSGLKMGIGVFLKLYKLIKRIWDVG